MGLAAFGYLNPLLAAFIHVSSELAFILNSTRLLPGDLTGAQTWTREPLSEAPVPRPAS